LAGQFIERRSALDVIQRNSTLPAKAVNDARETDNQNSDHHPINQTQAAPPRPRRINLFGSCDSRVFGRQLSCWTQFWLDSGGPDWTGRAVWTGW